MMYKYPHVTIQNYLEIRMERERIARNLGCKICDSFRRFCFCSICVKSKHFSKGLLGLCFRTKLYDSIFMKIFLQK